MLTMDDIIKEGHPTLREKAAELKFPLSEEERQTADAMLTFLKNSQDEEMAKKYNLRSGIGLAANQINVAKRMFALYLTDDNGEQLEFVAFNPKIASHSVESTYLANGEGCLSVDRDVPGYVPRHARITVKFKDAEGKEHKMRLKGIAAIAFQHELDHLNGVMFYDRIDEKNPFAEIPNASAYDR
ncbi:MAG TPA: peptide deformylase [Metalysinibacillus jejuensis]|uniref:Peptide deformylase n=1 Tax=Metalysinibacillus jejuensis TaxID=914327 RepID=A0A921NCA1_9BACL|nr:peptide deformylase [Metalysinibacillus jejuensis]HJH11877.1 peptide deformylase [Metalysinibacillus jejuensis]